MDELRIKPPKFDGVSRGGVEREKKERKKENFLSLLTKHPQIALVII